MFDDLIDKLSDSDIEQLSYEWALWARHAQLPPTGEWRCWLLMAGRGFVKMRKALAVSDFEEAARQALDSRWARQVGIRAIEICYMIEAG